MKWKPALTRWELCRTHNYYITAILRSFSSKVRLVNNVILLYGMNLQRRTGNVSERHTSVVRLNTCTSNFNKDGWNAVIRLMRTCCTFRSVSWHILLRTCYSQLKPFTLDSILDLLKGLNIVLSAVLAIDIYFISFSNDYTEAIEREPMDCLPHNLSIGIRFLTPIDVPTVLYSRLVIPFTRILAVIITHRTFSATSALDWLTCQNKVDKTRTKTGSVDCSHPHQALGFFPRP
jgi:hypothetical protein